MKTQQIRQTLVFYWFLFRNWINNFMDPIPTPIESNPHIIDMVPPKEKKNMAIKSKFTNTPPQNISTSFKVVQAEVVQAEVVPKEVVPKEVVPKEVVPTPKSSYDFLPAFKLHPNPSTWIAPAMPMNLNLIHDYFTQSFASLNQVVNFYTIHSNVLPIQYTIVMHNGEFTQSEADTISSGIIETILTQIIKKSNTVDTLPVDYYQSKNQKFVIKQQSSTDCTDVVNITSNIYTFEKNGIIYFCYTPGWNDSTVYGTTSDYVVVAYNGKMLHHYGEIFNALNPRVIYGSSFDVFVPTNVWRLPS